MKAAIYISLFLSAISLQLTSARPLYLYHVDQSHGRAETPSPNTNNNHGRAISSSPNTNNNHGRDVAEGFYHDNQNHGRDLPGSPTLLDPKERHAEALRNSFSTIVGHFLELDAVDVVASGISDLLARS